MMSTGGPSNSAMNDVLGLLQVLEFLKDGDAVKKAVAFIVGARKDCEAAQALAENAQRAAVKAQAEAGGHLEAATIAMEQASLLRAAVDARAAEVSAGADRLQLEKEAFEAIVVAHQADAEKQAQAHATATAAVLAELKQIDATRAQLADQQTQLDRRVERLEAAEAEHKAKVDKIVALATQGA